MSMLSRLATPSLLALLLPLLLPVHATGNVALATPENTLGRFQLGRWMNPKVQVPIDHPAELGLALETVVFRDVTGECSESIAATVRRALLDEGVTVLNRADLRTIVGELEFGESGFADPTAVEKIGEMYGPSVMITVDVTRCKWDQDRGTRRGLLGQRYVSQTEVFLKINVDVTDLATGQYLLAIGGDFDKTEENTSGEGYMEYPEVNDVLDLAYAAAAERVRRALLPWTEIREVTFYDDGECGMKRTVAAMKNGDYDTALDMASGGLDYCRNDPKMKRDKVARSIYNNGMMAVIRGDDETALMLLKESNALKREDITATAIATVETRMRQAQELKAQQEALQAEAAARAEERKRVADELKAKTLTNQKIIDMAPGGLPDEVIITMIKTSPCDFDVTPTGLTALNDAGVSTAIIMAMMERMSGQ